MLKRLARQKCGGCNTLVIPWASVVAYAEFIVEHDKLGQSLLADYGLEEAERMITDCYDGCFDSEVDFAWHLFEECYSNAIPDNLMCYLIVMLLLGIFLSMIIVR